MDCPPRIMEPRQISRKRPHRISDQRPSFEIPAFFIGNASPALPPSPTTSSPGFLDKSDDCHLLNTNIHTHTWRSITCSCFDATILIADRQTRDSGSHWLHCMRKLNFLGAQATKLCLASQTGELHSRVNAALVEQRELFLDVQEEEGLRVLEWGEGMNGMEWNCRWKLQWPLMRSNWYVG